jgi:hypothetical protein
MATNNIKHLICVGVFLAIVPAISFANQQGLAAYGRYDAHCDPMIIAGDTIPPVKEVHPTETKKIPIVKKVPKSRRQVKPVPLPGGPVKPIIKPKIIKRAITVSVL